MEKKFSKNWPEKTPDSDYRIPTIQHSTRVGKLKFAVIFISLFLILTLIIFPLTDIGKKSFKVTFHDTGDSSSYENPTMLKPRFHGMNKNNRPYNITADDAIKESENKVALQSINGDMLMKDGSWMTLLSETGDYLIVKRELDLNGSVNLIMDNGYQFFSESAHLNLDENMAAGNEATVVHGPLGILNADGFIIRDGGDNIFFHGNVHLVTKP